MKLSDLFLNRFLYRERQNIETKDSSYLSFTQTPPVVTPIASGDAAYDINTNYYTINGSQITPGTLPASLLDVSNFGWVQASAFTPTAINIVTWGGGNFTSANGEVYGIVAGTTGAMTQKTYIYLDLLTSETVYQYSTTASDAVGLGKVLVAVATPGVVVGTLAAYNLNQASQIISDNILANTLDASKIVAGQLIVGTNVGLGTAVTSGNVTTIIGNTVTTGFLNAVGIDAAYINAGTMTGFTIQTSSSGYRMKMNGPANQYEFLYDNNVLATLTSRAVPYSGMNGVALTGSLNLANLELSEQGEGVGDSSVGFALGNGDNSFLAIHDTAGNNFVGTDMPIILYSNTAAVTPYLSTLQFEETGTGTDLITIQAPSSIASSYTLTLPTTAGTNTYVLQTNGSGVLSWVAQSSGGATTALDNLSGVNINTHLIPQGDYSYNLGDSNSNWGYIYYGLAYSSGILQPANINGYIRGTDALLSRSNTSSLSFSTTYNSIGNYTLTHNLGSSTYTVLATALIASGSGARVAKVASLSTNSCVIITFDETGNLADSDFMFIINWN